MPDPPNRHDKKHPVCKRPETLAVKACYYKKFLLSEAPYRTEYIQFVKEFSPQFNSKQNYCENSKSFIFKVRKQHSETETAL